MVTRIAIILGLLGLAGAILFFFLFSSRPATFACGGDTPEVARNAESLEEKIRAIREAHDDPGRAAGTTETVTATTAELESYVICALREDIPARVETIRIGIEAGTISARTELAFDSGNSSGHPAVDLLLRGTHSLFVAGAMAGEGGRGRFALNEVRVDGIPVPVFVVEAIVDRFVKPRYPEVDLSQTFDLPWGIEQIVLSDGTAAITY